MQSFVNNRHELNRNDYCSGGGAIKVRYDYSDIGISNKIRSMKLENKLNTLDGYSLRKQIEHDYKINVTQILYNDINETKYLIAENLVEKVLKENPNKTSNNKERLSSATIYRSNKIMDQYKSTERPKTGSLNKKINSIENENDTLFTKRQFVQSAPINRQQKRFTNTNNVQIQELKLNKNINDKKNKSTESSSDKENSFRIDESVDSNESKPKTILRELNPKYNATMHVDKWVEVHQRRAKSAFLNINNQNRNTTVKFSEIENSKNNEVEEIKELQKKSGMIGRSRRELSELTVLDNVRKRNKARLQQYKEEMKKLSRKEEFNNIVNRIRRFLAEIEKFNLRTKNENEIVDTTTSKTDPNLVKRKFIKLYEY